MCSLVLGGGREKKESDIDLSVGLVIHKKVGDRVEKGEPLATIHANSKEKLSAAKERFLRAYTIENTPIENTPLIKGVITL
jgi:pyrimidine-nucleoside phosphorylase